MIGLLNRLRRRPVLPRKVPKRGVFTYAPDHDRRSLRVLLPCQVKRPAGQVLQLLPGKCLHLKDRVIAQFDCAAACRGVALRLEHTHGFAEPVFVQRRMAADLRAERLSLHRAIGINDKFLMIRDLFGGDGEAFDAALDALNGFGDLDDCMIYIAENYAWNANSDGAKLLMELLERKFA